MAHNPNPLIAAVKRLGAKGGSLAERKLEVDRFLAMLNADDPKKRQWDRCVHVWVEITVYNALGLRQWLCTRCGFQETGDDPPAMGVKMSAGEKLWIDQMKAAILEGALTADECAGAWVLLKHPGFREIKHVPAGRRKIRVEGLE